MSDLILIGVIGEDFPGEFKFDFILLRADFPRLPFLLAVSGEFVDYYKCKGSCSSTIEVKSIDYSYYASDIFLTFF